MVDDQASAHQRHAQQRGAVSGQADGFTDVVSANGATAAQARTVLGAVAVLVPAAEADPERGRERGFGHPRVR